MRRDPLLFTTQVFRHKAQGRKDVAVYPRDDNLKVLMDTIERSWQTMSHNTRLAFNTRRDTNTPDMRPILRSMGLGRWANDASCAQIFFRELLIDVVEYTNKEGEVYTKFGQELVQ